MKLMFRTEHRAIIVRRSRNEEEKMKMTQIRLASLTLLSCVSLSTIACSSELTAENITLEECQEIFGEDAAEPDKDAVEGDYNEDGTADEGDEAIAERCIELMTEDADAEES
jgi:hypothetical protein